MIKANNSGDKVFITGADGLLGTNTVMTFLKQGYQVKGLVHPGSKSVTLNDLNIEIIKGDILKPETYHDAILDADHVVHIAAATTLYPMRSERTCEINIEGSRALLNAAKVAKVKRFIFISSANIVSPGTSNKPGDENGAYDGWKYGSDYLDSKHYATQMYLDAYKKDGFPVIVIAPTFMIGPYDSAPSSGKLLLSFYRNKLPGYSKGVKNYVAVKDVAQAIVNATTKGRIGQVYLAGHQNMTYKAFFKTLAAVTKKPFRMVYIPFPILLFLGFISQNFSRLFRKTPILTYKIAQLSGMMQFYTAQKAVKELEMPQTDVRIAIEECLDWMVDNKVKL